MISIIIGVIVLLLFVLVVFRGAPYVPTHSREVKSALTKLYPLGTDDFLVDAGSGDGIVLRQASRYGARALGYELNPILVLISWLLARGNARVSTKLADFWYAEFPQETTVVYIFSVSRDADKLDQKIQREATRLNHTIALITYGASLKHRQVTKQLRGHHLYIFTTLQEGKA